MGRAVAERMRRNQHTPDREHLVDCLTNVGDMANTRAICADCGLEGWDGMCAECGCDSSLHPGSTAYGVTVKERAARMMAAGSTPASPADLGRDPLSTAIRHFAGGGAAVFTGSTRAASLGRFFVSLGWFLVVLSVIGGIALMATTESTGYRNEHPNVLAGVIVLVSGSIQGFVLVMIGSFVQATLEFQSLVGGFFKRLKTLSL